ncbi:hypothetical protein [Candidatus Poriferisodalis sp.]|uniref:hypothetical protein n=1 Tax=Candidatus Poriferisodalis sp. TaxID=3101277 RepID=UPI003B022C0C
MVLWFIGTSLLAMRWFFGDSAIDHRLVVAGALAPDVVYLLSGGAPVVHSLLGPVCILVAVMAITIGRRHARRRWLALPIGVFWHQVFDGAWTQPALLWWPFAGSASETGLPLSARPLWAIAVLELVGLAGCWWIWRTSGLARDAAVRAEFWRTGRIDRVVNRGPRRADPGNSTC